MRELSSQRERGRGGGGVEGGSLLDCVLPAVDHAESFRHSYLQNVKKN